MTATKRKRAVNKDMLPISAVAVEKIIKAQRHGWRVAHISIAYGQGCIMLLRETSHYRQHKAFLFFDGSWSVG